MNIEQLKLQPLTADDLQKRDMLIAIGIPKIQRISAEGLDIEGADIEEILSKTIVI